MGMCRGHVERFLQIFVADPIHDERVRIAESRAAQAEMAQKAAEEALSATEARLTEAESALASSENACAAAEAARVAMESVRVEIEREAAIRVENAEKARMKAEQRLAEVDAKRPRTEE